MNFDIKTAILILLIIHVIQTMIFYHQYRTNPDLKEIKWWLFWSLCEVFAFFFALLRDDEGLHSTAIIFQNLFMASGVIFLYIGTLKFFDKKVNFGLIAVQMSVFILIFVYFTIFNYNGTIRSIVINLYLSYFSIMPAIVLFKSKLHTKSSILLIIFSAFLFHGLLFGYRTIASFTGAVTAENMFEPNLLNIITFADALTVAILWTFGYLVLINLRMVKEIKESKDQFELIFNTSPDAVVITRLSDGMIVSINDNFVKILGFSREESVGQSSLKINIWKNQEDRAKVVRDVLDRGFCENYSAEFVRKDGLIIYGLMSASKFNLNGIPHIMSITRDISELKKIESEIIQSKTDWEDCFYSITDIITIHDKDFNIIRTNNAGEEILKIPSVLSNLKLKCYAFYHGTDMPPEGCPSCECFKKGMPGVFELYEKHLDRHIEIRAIPRFDNNNQLVGLIHIVRDITERRLYEEKLLKTSNELKQFNSMMVDREIKMVELKQEINELLKETGREPKY